MRRRWNWSAWAGFAVAVIAALSYIPLFARFPITRDVPWANLVLFAAAGFLLASGLHRAFAQSATYRGKIASPILAALSLGLCFLFCYSVFYAGRDLPPARAALAVGQRAPDFALAGVDWNTITLARLREGKRAVLLIFYRGYWWPLCNSELRSFERRLSEFATRGVQVAAITVDSPAESRKLCASEGYTFPILSDPKAETIRAYGVLHAGGGEAGRDIARPAEFLLDQAGTIRWENLTGNVFARLWPETALHAIDAMQSR
jgi:peroxiredoxin